MASAATSPGTANTRKFIFSGRAAAMVHQPADWSSASGRLARHMGIQRRRPRSDGVAVDRDRIEAAAQPDHHGADTAIAHDQVAGGTDHGHGNAMWLLGGNLRGGKISKSLGNVIDPVVLADLEVGARDPHVHGVLPSHRIAQPPQTVGEAGEAELRPQQQQ